MFRPLMFATVAILFCGPLLCRNAPADEAAQQKAIRQIVKDHRTDLVRSFYHSKALGRDQAFALFVPKSYDPAKASPVVVFLHSWWTNFEDKQWLRVAEIPGSIQDQCNQRGWIAVGPEAGGNTWYYGSSEQQVLETVDHLTKYLNIDANRLVLIGRSMGGAGALTVAMHHPDRVMGVVALAPVSDYVEFSQGNPGLLLSGQPGSVSGSFGGLPTDIPDAYRKMSAIHGVDVLKKLPIYIIHGGKDTIVPVSHSQKLVPLLKKAGGTVQYKEMPKEEHNMEMIEWFADEYFKFIDAHAGKAQREQAQR